MDIGELRRTYHQSLCDQLLGYRNGVLSNADRGSKTSATLAEEMFARMDMPPCANPPAEQTIGTRFANITMEFLEESFQILGHPRPGSSAPIAESIGAHKARVEESIIVLPAIPVASTPLAPWAITQSVILRFAAFVMRRISHSVILLSHCAFPLSNDLPTDSMPHHP